MDGRGVVDPVESNAASQLDVLITTGVIRPQPEYFDRRRDVRAEVSVSEDEAPMDLRSVRSPGASCTCAGHRVELERHQLLFLVSLRDESGPMVPPQRIDAQLPLGPGRRRSRP
jgi:hypothetical protein